MDAAVTAITLEKDEHKLATPEQISRLRGVKAETLRRRLVGDLAKVLLKALAKDAKRPYYSVKRFPAHLTQRIEGLAVIARKSTMIYRVSEARVYGLHQRS